MAAQHNLSFANFILRFGKEKVLLDYLKEIVLPAFMDESLNHVHGQSRYVFLNPRIVELDRANGVFGVWGTFVKDTILIREQILKQRKLVHRPGRMQSSPSAKFVLILNSHKLLYYPETAYAPSVSSFKSTVKSFLRQKHKEYIDQLISRESDSGANAKKSELVKLHPHPTLEIIPLSSGRGIKDFLSQFSHIRSVGIRLVTPNDEEDWKDAWQAINDSKERIGASSTSVVHTGNKENGLDPDETAQNIDAAAGAGNATVKISGLDGEGNKLKGNNEEFQVAVPVDLSELSDANAPKKLFQTYSDYLREGIIRVGRAMYDPAGTLRAKLRGLI
jgi:hypothetical protein